jgi:LacI family transcriptional regulator
MRKKSVTIKDVAKEAGLSVSAVSKAFNEYSDIREITRKHILDVAQRMGYKPNIAAKSLSSGKKCRIGMLIEDYKEGEDYGVDPFTFRLTLDFKNEVSRQGYETVLLSTTSDIQKVQSISSLVEEKQVDGIFIIGLKTTDEFFRQMEDINYPIVLWDIEVNNPKVCCVGVNNTKGAFIAVEYLIKQGHERIGFINGNKDAFVSYERLDGYYLALNRYGIPIDNNLILHSDFTYKGGVQCAQELIQRDKGITAVFCASDLIAIGAINGFQREGYSIPKDISIVGFDDIDFARYINPMLTTIRQDKGLVGRIAANTLINMINGQNTGRIMIEPELIIRESAL